MGGVVSSGQESRGGITAVAADLLKRVRKLEAVPQELDSVGASVYRTASPQTIPTSVDIFGSFTNVEFNGVSWDSGGMVDLGSDPEQILIVTAGMYLLIGSVHWDPGETDSAFRFMLVNGGADDMKPNISGQGARLGSSWVGNLASNTPITLRVIQGSGGNADVTTAALGVYYLGKPII